MDGVTYRNTFIIFGVVALWFCLVYGNGLTNGVFMTMGGMCLLLVSLRDARYFFVFFFLAAFFGRYKLFYYENTFYPDLLILMCAFLYLVKYSFRPNLLILYLLAVNFVLIYLGRNSMEYVWQYVVGIPVFYIFAQLILMARGEGWWRGLTTLVFAVFFVSMLLDLFGIDLTHTSRSQVQTIYMTIGGINIYRPNGVSGNIYAAGSFLLMSYFVYYFVNRKTFDTRQFWLLFCTLLLCSFSQRIMAIPTLLLPVYWILVRMGRAKLFLVFFLAVMVAALFNFRAVIPHLDASNALKVSLSYLTLMDYWLNLDASSFLFGNGLESSAFIAARYKYDWIVSQFQIKGWDIDPRNLQSGFAIHNSFTQILYENGVTTFLLVGWYIFRSFRSKVLDPVGKFLLGALVFNYLVHNGLYNQMLLTTIFIATSDPEAGRPAESPAAEAGGNHGLSHPDVGIQRG